MSNEQFYMVNTFQLTSQVRLGLTHRTITQHVERSSQEQARGGRQMTSSIEQISAMVNNLNTSQRNWSHKGEQILDAAKKIEESARAQEQTLRQLGNALERLRRSIAA
jgi:methyl-accepting chemotaxis protein